MPRNALMIPIGFDDDDVVAPIQKNHPNTAPNRGTVYKLFSLLVVTPLCALTIALSRAPGILRLAAALRNFPTNPEEALTPHGRQQLLDMLSESSVLKAMRAARRRNHEAFNSSSTSSASEGDATADLWSSTSTSNRSFGHTSRGTTRSVAAAVEDDRDLLTMFEPASSCLGLDAEPLKRRTNLPAEVDGGQPVFLKFSCARNIPLALQAIIGAMQTAPREVALYSELEANERAQSPAKFRIPRGRMVVPRMLGARWSMWQHQAVLALEMIDQTKYVVIPDSSSDIHVNLVRLVVTRAAEMHALNWQPPSTVLPEVLSRAGFGFMGLVDLTKGDRRNPTNPHYSQLWAAMSAWATAESAKPDGCLPMTVGHCDCRPGNMMFRRDIAADPTSPTSERAILHDADAIVFTDWEGATVLPWLWDCVYCMSGLTTATRVAHERAIVAEYMRALVAALRTDPTKVDEAARIEGMPQAQVDLVVAMVKLAMNLFGIAMVSAGLVGSNHGNSKADTKAWGARLAAFALEASQPSVGVAEVLGLPQSCLDQFAEIIMANAHRAE